jgi:2-iminobutanoate/2-iminopropanoate deaminase
MKTFLCMASAAAVFSGCGPSEDDVRAIVQRELANASVRTEVTNAQVIGPYSPAVKVGRLLFISGQIGLDPETGQLSGTDIEGQTQQALRNLGSVLSGAGFDSSQVVQCTVFLKDMNDFQRMNLIYGGYFREEHYPARTTVEVSNLPRNAIVEIAAIAYKSE